MRDPTVAAQTDASIAIDTVPPPVKRLMLTTESLLALEGCLTLLD